MAKLHCFIHLCVFIFFHNLFEFGYGDFLEVPPFHINKKSLLKYLSLGNVKIDLPALYVFGDSYIDSGNSIALKNEEYKYLPYGIDFDHGQPTGRTTNGRTGVDFIATVGGLPYPPPIICMSKKNRKTIRTGVNYGSSAAGILPENGRFLHMNVLNFNQQVDLFKNTTVKDLKSSFKNKESFKQYLAKSVFFIHIGSNDLGVTYEAKFAKKKKYADVQELAKRLIKRLSHQLKRLYKDGARKFLVSNVPPIGCIPFNVHTKNHTGSCVEKENQRAVTYNKLLPNLLTKLQSTLPGSKFAHADMYKVFQDAITSPSAYGFKDVNTSCCTDRNGTKILPCAPNVVPCVDRKTRVFFDPTHPTESMHFLWARRFLKDSSVCSPMTLIELIQA